MAPFKGPRGRRTANKLIFPPKRKISGQNTTTLLEQIDNYVVVVRMYRARVSFVRVHAHALFGVT